MVWDSSIALESFSSIVPLTPEERIELAKLLSRQMTFRARQRLPKLSDFEDHLLFVLGGWIAEHQLMPKGDRQLLYIALPGELLTTQSIVYPNSNLLAEALSTGAIAFIDIARLNEGDVLLTKLRAALFLGAVRRNVILQQSIGSLGRQCGHRRVGRLILELVARSRLRRLSYGNRVFMPLRQQDIANATGLTAPYVNRILTEMRDGGLLNLRSGYCEIFDEEKLIDMASFDPSYLESPRTPRLLDSIRLSSDEPKRNGKASMVARGSQETHKALILG